MSRGTIASTFHTYTMTSFTSGDQFMFSSDSSDDEEELMMMVAIEEEELRTQGRTRHRGSVLGHAVIDRGHQEGAARLFRDYFSNNPVYGDILFRRRFRMSRALFLRIATAVENHDPWFRQKRDATGKLGLSPLQKMTAAIRQLAYGVSADAVDEYVRIGGSTAMLALTKFVEAVVLLFFDEYLRSPTAEDTARLLAIGEQRGFPADGTAPPVSYTINGTTYDMGYYLGDGIYPEWATIVKPIPSPRGNKSMLFSAIQAAVRKDVERAFDVLQSRFAIIRGPERIWEQRTLHNIMTACIIMHNMIIEDERGGTDVDEVFEYMGEKATIEGRDPDQAVLQYIEATEAIRNRAIHHQLRDDLVEHIWSRHGAQY
ncbi:uncharacterized protein LOC133927592 [Phragmites australis]|uniref:uncharacterized protein LOC133927592 n=1 Tax=Phragmites australis TaxID=29695 RepID=UPI002D79F11D|nr:uncharacterized protein LOC133927592 [Phragmites australis]